MSGKCLNCGHDICVCDEIKQMESIEKSLSGGKSEMKCKYCKRGMMFIISDECSEVYQCISGCSIAIKDIELNNNKYEWYKIDKSEGENVKY